MPRTIKDPHSYMTVQEYAAWLRERAALVSSWPPDRRMVKACLDEFYATPDEVRRSMEKLEAKAKKDRCR